MKKSLIAIALLCVGTAAIAAAPIAPEKAAKTAKPLKQYGPISVVTGDADHITYATNGVDLLELKKTADVTELTATLSKVGAAKYDKETGIYTMDQTKNKVKLGNNVMPIGYLAKGGVKMTSWADYGIQIVGFKSKTVFLRLTANATGDVRYYAYQLGTSKKTKQDDGSYVYTNNKDAKVVGSTSNILAIDDGGQAVSDGKKIWIVAANDAGRGNANDYVMEFDKKLNGLYKTKTAGDYSKVKCYNAKKEIVAATADAIILPTFKSAYSYLVEAKAGGTEIKIYK